MLIPVTGALALDGAGLVTLFPARKNFDRHALADQVALLHTMQTDALVDAD